MPTVRPRDTFAAQASGLSGPHRNHLLETLPDDVYERLRPHLELRELKLGEVLYEPGERLPYVYFPASTIISLLYVMEDGASAEIAIVGNEGILGISLFMGGESTTSRAVVQSAGLAFQLKAQWLIHYQRGRITVLDRSGLEARSCECYQVVKSEYDRPLPYLPKD
jgi:hypothetical protein